MRYVPHEYQEWATRNVVVRPAYGLLLPMGLGKTVIMLTAIDELINNRFAVCKVLIIAPLRVARDTWARELAKWDHLQGRLKMISLIGNKDERIAALDLPGDVYLINREMVVWLVEYFEGRHIPWPFDCLVIDELSSFKSWKSKRFKALRRSRKRVKRIYGLTGTPAPNGLLDLWSQIFLLDGGQRLGTGICKYRDRWFFPEKVDKYDPNIVYTWGAREGAKEEIYGLISDITASVEAGTVKLPERVDVEHYVDIPVDEYQAMVNYFCVDQIEAVNAAVVINKLLQIANGFIYDESGKAHPIHDEKLEKLKELFEAANGNRIIIYYQFDYDKSVILKYFETIEGLRVSELRTPASITAWMAGELDVAVAHAASTGHGLNLQEHGHIIIWYGVPWSLELYQQANARLHRQGQRETVFVHHILARGTVDEDVLYRLQHKDLGQRELLERLLWKNKNAKCVVAPAGSGLTKGTTSVLGQLFAPAQPASV